MKNKDLNINLKSLPALMGGILRKLNAYKMIAFFIIVAAVYGFILWRINVSSSTPANQNEETAKTVVQPHIDPAVVQKILSLQNNSVNVQALFNAARQNPFQE